MMTLQRIYLVVCLLVSGWFATAAYKGWRTEPVFPQQQRGGAYRSSGSHGFFYFGGGGGSRSSGGSWGGGK